MKNKKFATKILGLISLRNKTYFYLYFKSISMNPSKPTTIEEYIASFPKDTQQTLNELRKLVIATVPNSIESISYGMPAYKLNGKPLIYFAAFKHHIGIYATPITHEAFADELSAYKQG